MVELIKNDKEKEAHWAETIQDARKQLEDIEKEKDDFLLIQFKETGFRVAGVADLINLININIWSREQMMALMADQKIGETEDGKQ